MGSEQHNTVEWCSTVGVRFPRHGLQLSCVPSQITDQEQVSRRRIATRKHKRVFEAQTRSIKSARLTTELALQGGDDKCNSLGCSTTSPQKGMWVCLGGWGGGGVKAGCFGALVVRLTIKLALHGWDDKGNSLGCSSSGGDNVEGSSPSTTQVTVRRIQQPLVSSVGVSCGHCTLDNSELVFQHLQTRLAHGIYSAWMGHLTFVLKDLAQVVVDVGKLGELATVCSQVDK